MIFKMVKLVYRNSGLGMKNLLVCMTRGLEMLDIIISSLHEPIIVVMVYFFLSILLLTPEKLLFLPVQFSQPTPSLTKTL